MAQLDIHAMIEQVHYPSSVQDYLGLFGDMLVATQAVVKPCDEEFVAQTDHEKLLVMSINRDITTLTSIYILLRCELLHQAAAHVRLFCESLITQRYIANDVTNRVPRFLDYADVERYEIATTALEWEEERACSAHAVKVRELLASLKPKYETIKRQYTFTDKKGQTRQFTNWCNTAIANQAKQCGLHMQRLYSLVYSQLSSYVHGSAWSLRRQLSYSARHYDAHVVLNDIATIIRTTFVVWEEWAKFCDEQLGWSLGNYIPEMATRLTILDLKHFPIDRGSL